MNRYFHIAPPPRVTHRGTKLYLREATDKEKALYDGIRVALANRAKGLNDDGTVPTFGSPDDASKVESVPTANKKRPLGGLMSSLRQYLPQEIRGEDLVGRIYAACNLLKASQTGRISRADTSYSLPEIIRAMRSNGWKEQQVEGGWIWVTT